MALYQDETQLFYPVYSAFNVSNSSAASGWKTIDWATVEIDTTEIAESSGTITTQEAGYYYCHFNYIFENFNKSYLYFNSRKQVEIYS